MSLSNIAARAAGSERDNDHLFNDLYNLIEKDRMVEFLSFNTSDINDKKEQHKGRQSKSQDFRAAYPKFR